MAAPLDDNSYFVLLNGEIVGYTNCPDEAVANIRMLDYPGESPYYAPSIYSSASDRTVQIHTEDGRIVRPLLVVAKLHLLNPNANVDCLIKQGVLRYVDAAEISTLDVALIPSILETRSEKPHLLEVHANLILGVTAALIPLLQANQSPRNAYQTSMGPYVVFCGRAHV
jgi:DNA-directed RNA polymerase subunit B